MSFKSAPQVLLTYLRASPFLYCARLMQIHQDCRASITCCNKQGAPVPRKVTTAKSTSFKTFVVGCKTDRHTSFVKHASFTNNHLSLHWLPRVLGQDSIFKFATIPLSYQQFARRLGLSKTSARPLDFSRLHPHTTYVYVRVFQHNLLFSLEQIQALTFWPKMSISSMTPFRSTSRPRI